jgi:CRISPR-associated protein Cas6
MSGAPAPAMVDVAFPLHGTELPRDHRWLLGQALAAEAPGLAREPGAGPHEVKLAPGGGERAWLSARSRLTLRAPRARWPALAALAGRRLSIGADTVRLGPAQLRELLPHRTLYAGFVDAGAAGDEGDFIAAMGRELDALRIACDLICGRARRMGRGRDGQNGQNGEGGLAGFSLMLHGLRPDDARRVLEAGLGPNRWLGCGLFVPHKSAAAVGD